MTDKLRKAISAQRSRFIEVLLARGFAEIADASDEFIVGGEVRYTDKGGTEVEEVVTISVPLDFPYVAPRVKTTTGAAGLTWHRYLDQTLCLWPTDYSVADLPWSDADALLERVRRWLELASDDWPEDMPVPDLDRYFGPVSGAAFLFDGDELGFESNCWFDWKLEKVGDTEVMHMGGYGRRPPLVARRRGQTGRTGRYGFAADVGELERPPAGWAEFEGLIGADSVKHLRMTVSMHGSAIALIRYTIPGLVEPGVIPLLLTKNDPRSSIEIEGSLTPVPAGREVRTMRGGSQFEELGSKSVAVVGVGAVGSFVADHLVRSGIGRIGLYDHDLLRPGNSIRHLAADERDELLPKVEAVSQMLSQYGFVTDDVIEAHTTSIASVEDVERLFAHYDLVVDATASGAASTLLAEAAEPEVRVVQVASHRDGGVISVDVYPHDDDHKYVPDLEHVDSSLREAGCGDPISPTPPNAVITAAGLTADIAIRLLLGSPAPASTWYVRDAQDDAPLDRVGFVQ